MNHAIQILCLLSFFFITNCNSISKNSPPIDNYAAKIDSLIQTTHPRKFNGVILITQKGKIKYSRAYGFSNFEEKTPISIKDNFRIQSNSKQITAALILREVEKGEIDLNETISAYLPHFGQPWADSVTVHHLLNMSSGIRGIDRPLIFAPGTDYRYSNPAYGVLGAIIEEVTGHSYVDTANKLFTELSMNNTYCYEFGANQNNLINGYVNAEDGYTVVDFYSRGITPEGWLNFIPAGGIISNAEDLNTWDTKLHNGQILKPESYELMVSYSIRGQHAAFGAEPIGYGYGVRIDDSDSLKIIGHAGKGIGFTNIKFYIPERKLSVIVLENVYDEDAAIVYHFERELVKMVMDSSL